MVTSWQGTRPTGDPPNTYRRKLCLPSQAFLWNRCTNVLASELIRPGGKSQRRFETNAPMVASGCTLCWPANWEKPCRCWPTMQVIGKTMRTQETSMIPYYRPCNAYTEGHRRRSQLAHRYDVPGLPGAVTAIPWGGCWPVRTRSPSSKGLLAAHHQKDEQQGDICHPQITETWHPYRTYRQLWGMRQEGWWRSCGTATEDLVSSGAIVLCKQNSTSQKGSSCPKQACLEVVGSSPDV